MLIYKKYGFKLYVIKVFFNRTSDSSGENPLKTPLCLMIYLSYCLASLTCANESHDWCLGLRHAHRLWRFWLLQLRRFLKPEHSRLGIQFFYDRFYCYFIYYLTSSVSVLVSLGGKGSKVELFWWGFSCF